MQPRTAGSPFVFDAVEHFPLQAERAPLPAKERRGSGRRRRRSELTGSAAGLLLGLWALHGPRRHWKTRLVASQGPRQKLPGLSIPLRSLAACSLRCALGTVRWDELHWGTDRSRVEETPVLNDKANKQIRCSRRYCNAPRTRQVRSREQRRRQDGNSRRRGPLVRARRGGAETVWPGYNDMATTAIVPSNKRTWEGVYGPFHGVV